MATFGLEARCVPATGESAVLLCVDDKRGGKVEVLLSLREAMALASNLVGLVDDIVAADSAVARPKAVQ